MFNDAKFMKNIKTLKVRVKDKHASRLKEMAKSVNLVWNFCAELSYRKITERGVFMSGFDFQPYIKGATYELPISTSIIQEVSQQYAAKRKAAKKAKLAWRKSFGARRSLGWVPFKKRDLIYRDGMLLFKGEKYDAWDSYGLENYEFRSGCFAEDSRGRWYLCVTVEAKPEQSQGTAIIGIDLGCKDAATCSNGEKISGRRYRELEADLGKAQRARNKNRVKAIHAKIKNRRNDDLHKFSRNLVNKNAAIFVGNVNPRAIAKTKMAKSSLDAGWGMLKVMLKYKCEHAGVIYEDVNEAYTTQTCSSCGVVPDSSPKGRVGLRIREWQCECGVIHDRDVNAAANILAAGHRRLAEEEAKLA